MIFFAHLQFMHRFFISRNAQKFRKCKKHFFASFPRLPRIFSSHVSKSSPVRAPFFHLPKCSEMPRDFFASFQRILLTRLQFTHFVAAQKPGHLLIVGSIALAYAKNTQSIFLAHRHCARASRGRCSATKMICSAAKLSAEDRSHIWQTCIGIPPDKSAARCGIRA